LDTVDSTNVIQLSALNQSELEDLYRLAYPGNWFEPRMLETGHYYGIRQNATLVAW
jgi:hypothetical protein